jgi:hypothetical protein
LQIVGRPFDESTVLGAGHAYEQATECTADAGYTLATTLGGYDIRIARS